MNPNDNYLIVHDLLVARLRDKLNDFMPPEVQEGLPCIVDAVASDEEMAAIVNSKALTLFVVYAGDVDDTAQGGIVNTDVTQLWLVLVALRRGSYGSNTHLIATQKAGKIMSAVRKCLVGYSLSGNKDISPLKQMALTELRGRPTYTDNAVYLPMYFTAKIRLTTERI